MIQVFINGLPAVVREDAEINYIAENSMFSDSEGYSLSIEFPVAGCAENIRIFGHICRKDVDKPAALMRCSIMAGSFSRTGSLSVVDVSEKVVKAQFLEGVNPEEEKLIVDDTLISDLDLGEYPESDPENISVADAVAGTGDEVCYPWYNMAADVPNNLFWINRSAAQSGEIKFTWQPDITRKLSWQPYLLTIVRRILDGVRYSYDLSALEESEWKDVIICNTLPGVWGLTKYADALPQWTVAKFFQNLGITLHGSFIFDHSRKMVSFRPYSDINNRFVILDRVVDQYTASVSRDDEEDADFLPIRKFKYKDQDCTVWKYLFAPYIRKARWNRQTFDSFIDMKEATKFYGTLNYVKDLQTWFVFRCFWTNSRYSQLFYDGHSLTNPMLSYKDFQPVDVFSPPNYDKDDSYEDLEIMPVMVDMVAYGKMFWLPGFEINSEDETDFGDPNVSGVDSSLYPLDGSVHKWSEIPAGQTNVARDIENRTDETDDAFFSEILLGKVSPNPLYHPYPIVDTDVDFHNVVASTRIFRLPEGGAGGVSIDPNVKYTFKFLADSIPEVSSVFIIDGKRYICKRIETTITARGLSALMKGEFFRCL